DSRLRERSLIQSGRGRSTDENSGKCSIRFGVFRNRSSPGCGLRGLAEDRVQPPPEFHDPLSFSYGERRAGSARQCTGFTRTLRGPGQDQRTDGREWPAVRDQVPFASSCCMERQILLRRWWRLEWKSRKRVR